MGFLPGLPGEDDDSKNSTGPLLCFFSGEGPGQSRRAAGAILPGLILRSAYSIARHIAKLSKPDLGARDAR